MQDLRSTAPRRQPVRCVQGSHDSMPCRAEPLVVEGASVEQRKARADSQRASFSELSAERRTRRNTLARGWYAKNPRTRMLMHARKTGREQNVPVTITVADIVIPPACLVCGVPLATGTGSGPAKASPSLDRYEPTRGYVPGNIMVICADCNRRKQNHTGEQLVELGQAVIAAKAAYDQLYLDELQRS